MTMRKIVPPTSLSRRGLLQGAAAGGLLSWLTPLSVQLARAEEQAPHGAPPRSVIMLWLEGGPSQLETFDPHPGSAGAAGSEDRATNVPGVRIAKGFEQLADQMDSVALVRSVVSKEGDHERAAYNAKTGYRPDQTLVHPSLGAVICHQLPDNLEIPRHVSIVTGSWPGRGGYLGDQYDAFQVGDPIGDIQDIRARVPESRRERRLRDLQQIVEPEFARGRLPDLDARRTLQSSSTQAAMRMMTSQQLRAFDVRETPQALREEFGDSPFGRGCLAAVQLIEAGVRCVEVTLTGWDSHANNHSIQAERVATLDPAFAALLRELKRRGLFESTVVVCGGEFGRTPRLNPAEGRDHWPHGFTVALAGGRIRGGAVYGQTAPDPDVEAEDKTASVALPRDVSHIQATVLHALGIDLAQTLQTPIGRPMDITQGEVIQEILL